MDALGDRMKMYEGRAEPVLMPGLPILARVDGRSFHTFTRGMTRPFDEKMSLAMYKTARLMAMETNACVAYVQSDEISLMWYSDDPDRQTWFGGRHSKMVSQLGAFATLFFNEQVARYMPERVKMRPTFDARVWQVPSQMEAANAFLWREQDATKNSIQMAAQAVCSHAELQGKHQGDQHELLFKKGVNWNDYPAFFKRGQFIQRRIQLRAFTTDELDLLPPKHAARTNPDLKFERSVWEAVEMPAFGKVVNRAAVLFDGAEPATMTQVEVKRG